jgi:hypothetical protein
VVLLLLVLVVVLKFLLQLVLVIVHLNQGQQLDHQLKLISIPSFLPKKRMHIIHYHILPFIFSHDYPRFLKKIKLYTISYE